MIGVEPVYHLGDVVHRIPHFGVGVVEVQLVADTPDKHGRVVFVLQYFGLDFFELVGH